MNKAQKIKEIKKRSLLALFLPIVLLFIWGMSAGATWADQYCKTTYLICSSTFDIQAMLFEGLLCVLLYGLPLGFMYYSLTKWKLLGYNVSLPTILLRICTALLAPFIIADIFFGSILYIPLWLGIICLIVFYGSFIISVVIHFKTKRTHRDALKTGTAPKTTIEEVIKKEKAKHEALSRAVPEAEEDDSTEDDDEELL